MNNCTEITVYFFPEFRGETIDEARDVPSTMGGFTWRCEGDEVPKALRIVQQHVTFEESNDILELAKSIRDRFDYHVHPLVCYKIAEALSYKVARERARLGNNFHYEHSDGYLRRGEEMIILGAD